MKNVKIFVSKKREENHGGVKRDRTADLLNAIQALSQLSYNPKKDLVFYLFMPYNILKVVFIK